jgi:lipid-A-disaccharide synthase
VPTVTLYKASWVNYQLAKQVVKVSSLTMPNLLAGEEIYPEFIQSRATSEAIARAALDLLQDENRRAKVKARLETMIGALGGPGANRRAARAIVKLLQARTGP